MGSEQVACLGSSSEGQPLLSTYVLGTELSVPHGLFCSVLTTEVGPLRIFPVRRRKRRLTEVK